MPGGDAEGDHDATQHLDRLGAALREDAFERLRVRVLPHREQIREARLRQRRAHDPETAADDEPTRQGAPPSRLDEDDGVVAVDEEPGGRAHHLRNGAGDEHRRGVVKGRGRMPRARRDDGAPRPVEVDDVRRHGALFDPASYTLGIAAYDDDGVERAGEVRLPT